MAYALRNEGKVVGLFTNRENAEEYMRRAVRRVMHATR